MAKSPRYEETLYFLQTLGPSRPSESDSADDYFAGICPHHTSFNHAGAQSDHPYFSLFRYDTSGAYAHLKWRATEVIDATQAYPCASDPKPSHPAPARPQQSTQGSAAVTAAAWRAMGECGPRRKHGTSDAAHRERGHCDPAARPPWAGLNLPTV